MGPLLFSLPGKALIASFAAKTIGESLKASPPPSVLTTQPVGPGPGDKPIDTAAVSAQEQQKQVSQKRRTQTILTGPRGLTPTGRPTGARGRGLQAQEDTNIFRKSVLGIV